MFKTSKFIKRHVLKLSSVILPAIAIIFALAPCSGKLYEPKLPEMLRN